ncbi:hypothetical protein FHL15_000016 [Xylaria flabelliformis]|uniref:BZIP domain-containing protein n=1 Tax=Xylaria flabelliformis TaxID=2512241 RepID=A0A553IER4_9PEZI|nr:hypothetical protein FHL15_000016 [Xylaria flabelliformis]
MDPVDKSTPDIGYRKPKNRQRIHKKPPALAVPDINDDATERKRVLNVLAQRRYRERKKQERGRGRAEDATSSPQSNKTQDIESGSPAPVSETLALENQLSFSAYLNLPSPPDSASASLGFDSNAILRTRWPSASFESTGTALLSGAEESCPNIENPSRSTLPAGASVTDGETTPLDSLDISDPDPLLSSSSTDISFPDSYYLPIHELVLFRGLNRIANRLRCNTTTIWQLDANSPFNDGTHTALTTENLPPAWRPTLSQLTVPHHPVIDLLPWPKVRDRIIMILSSPDESRPPAASGPSYDLEDSAEGARIWGDDPCEPTSWEVGQVLFERWWFIFDRQVIDQSNYWRKLRGAATLSAKG